MDAPERNEVFVAWSKAYRGVRRCESTRCGRSDNGET